jgi:hypothetical protein
MADDGPHCGLRCGGIPATTTTQLAINFAQAARSRRETYVGPRLPGPVDTSADPGLGVDKAAALISRDSAVVTLATIDAADHETEQARCDCPVGRLMRFSGSIEPAFAAYHDGESSRDSTSVAKLELRK